MRARDVAAHLLHRFVEILVEGNARSPQHFARFRQPIAHEPRTTGTQGGNLASASPELRELGQVGDAAEDVDEHDLQRSAPRRAIVSTVTSRVGLAAQPARADVEKVVRASTRRAQLVDQHHRQPRAGRKQSDLAFGIDDHVVEAMFDLERDFRVAAAALRREPAQRRLGAQGRCRRSRSSRRLRSSEPSRLDEKRIDLDQHRLALEEDRRERYRPRSQGERLRGLRSRRRRRSTARDDRVGFGRDDLGANRILRQRFDLHAAGCRTITRTPPAAASSSRPI